MQVVRRLAHIAIGPTRRSSAMLLFQDRIAGCSRWTVAQTLRTYSTRKENVAIQDADLFGDSEAGGQRPGVEAEEPLDEDEPLDDALDLSRPYELLDRPRLPGSIKKLNRILARQRRIEIPESELDEKFVKGGQAINKTNSSVSLTHIPTGIRVQAQPTRSREENRKVARKILAERLEVLRATGGNHIEQLEVDVTDRKGLRKVEEMKLSENYTKAEIKAEKERRRKANRAKKAKRKYGKVEEADDKGYNDA
ncbi:hypothetical protein CI109_101585 [Kwoniella shandongensis]|uniref:Prokaryotic-type class I peptide chain release factors domain-containing protein n=1 Tax=Kwoniella shandongensis TaxID=1734106 RepID=A0AAJ8LEJ9_9TREE